jgi:hypothetical protein
MLSTFCTCNSRAGTATRAYVLRYHGRRHSDANVFWGLEQFLRETASVTPTEDVNVGPPRTVRTPTDEDSQLQLWNESRGEAQAISHEHRPYHYSRSAHLFADDRPLRM